MNSLRRQIVGYLPATVVPALVSFISVYTFTRLLPASEYGRYNVAFSGVMVGQAMCFYALQVGILKYFPAAKRDRNEQRFLKSTYLAFVTLAAAASLLFFAAFLLSPARLGGRRLALMALAVFLLRSTVTINQTTNQAAGRIKRLNLVECVNSSIAYLAGAALVLSLLPSAEGVMAGLALGALFSLIIDHWALGRLLAPVPFDRQLLRDIALFSGPLAVSFWVGSLLQNADRFLLGSFNGAAAVGIYVVAVTLIDRPLALICAAINTATFPLMTHAMEHDGVAAASEKMVRSGTLLLAVAAPACVGLAIASTVVATVMIGPEFRPGVIALIPIVALASFVRAASVHFLEHAFHLSGRSRALLAIYVPITLSSIVANYLLLPRFGVFAAAWISVAAQCVLAAAEVAVGRRRFPFAFPYLEVVRIGVACAGMAVVLTSVHFSSTWAGLAETISCGIAAYLAFALVVNLGGLTSRTVGKILALATSR